MDQPASMAITGLGAAANLGLSPEEIWRGVLEGRDALGPMPGLEQRPAPDKGGGQAAELPAEYQPTLPRAARYLRFVIERALADRGGALPPAPRVAAVFGTTLHGMRAGGEFIRSGDASQLKEFLGASVLSVALEGLGVGGARLTNCSACSSGLGSIALGCTLLATGQADLVIAGGYDTVSEYAYAGFNSLGLVTPGAIRPFEKDRDGMKVAEGYAAVVLERGAGPGGRIHALVAGIGESSDSFHLTQPQPDGGGAGAAIRAALAEAGIAPDVIDLISAHATATPSNDAAEYAAMAGVFGDRLQDVPVVTLKRHLGHTLGAAGALELILTIVARRGGVLPGVPAASVLDPSFRGLRMAGGPRAVRTSASLSLGFGGANTCVVLADRPARGPKKASDQPVITGFGLVLPGARSGEELLALVRAGRPPASDSGPIDEASYAYLLNARRTRRMSDYSKLTLAAASAACAHAGLMSGSAELREAGAILGTTQGATNFCEAYYTQVVREGIAAANPALFAEGVPNAAAAHLSMTLGLRGCCQTIIGARSSGLDALALAALRVREGRASRLIVGAAEEHSEVVKAAYAACGRPGLRTGAASVALVVEGRETAAARGALVLGVVGRVGSSSHPDAADAVLGALGRPDLACGAAAVLPELFSVGPLAEVVAALSGVLLRPTGVLAREFTGACTGVELLPP